MLKTLLGRTGKDALSFFALRGAQLPPEADGFSYDATYEGIVVRYTGQIAKGSSTLTLPRPVLAKGVVMLVAPHPEFLDICTKVEAPQTVFWREEGTITLRLSAKEAISLDEPTPVAAYFLIGS